MSPFRLCQVQNDDYLHVAVKGGPFVMFLAAFKYEWFCLFFLKGAIHLFICGDPEILHARFDACIKLRFNSQSLGQQIRQAWRPSFRKNCLCSTCLQIPLQNRVFGCHLKKINVKTKPFPNLNRIWRLAAEAGDSSPRAAMPIAFEQAALASKQL